jgi:diguanylate cyclase (GGDEF)-like protein
MRKRRPALPRWAPMAAAMAVAFLVYASWQLFRWTSGDRRVVGDVFVYPFEAAAIGAAWGASRRCGALPRLASGWRLIAVACAVYLTGDVVQTVYEAVGTLPFPSLADVFYLTFYPLMLAGLLRFADAHSSGAERVRRGLDLAVVAIGGAAVVLYLVLGPTVVEAGPNLLQGGVSIAYPSGDMVLFVGLASLILRRAAPSAHRALQFMAVGVLFFVAADLIYGYLSLHSTYQGGDFVDTVWIVAIALFAVAGAAQAPAGEAIPDGLLATARTGVAPYLASAVGFGLLIFTERHNPLFPDLSLVLAAVAIAALVSTRQFLAERDLIATQGELSRQSLHDALTGLPNRVLLYDRAAQMLARARRRDGPLAALYVDIDSFKQINDGFGHHVGDALLTAVGARLQAAVREADAVGRLGGDEFAVLVDEPRLPADPVLVAERLLEVLGEPFELAAAGGRSLSITVSIGIAYGHQSKVEDLLRDADLALYEAKSNGKNRAVVFESRMAAAMSDRVQLQMGLGAALAAGQFFLVYQPIFDLEAEAMTGVEALIRWRHPERGVLAPDSFIPLAEDSGMIVAIGRWVLREACSQVARWRREGHRLDVSVNVSAHQFSHEGLVGHVREALDASELEPSALMLEITETALMRDADAAAARLGELKAAGVRIAIDDFGVGYSSLAFLRHFPADALKIDRSFVSGHASNHKFSNALIHTLVELGRTLGMQTIGEGIEDREQLKRLQRERCDLGQGYLFARPLDPSGVEELMALASSSAQFPAPAGAPNNR